MNDVIIVGAGAAGLAAARELQAAGLRIVVLEARPRLGGRIFTKHDPHTGMPIELGAELIHGRADTLQEIIEAVSLRTVEVEGGRWESHRGAWRAAPDFWDRLDRVMRLLPKRPRNDYSFGEFVSGRPGGRRLARDRRLAAQFVESFHAANPALASGTALADAGSPGDDVRERRLARLVDGYRSIVDWLAEPVRARIRTSSVVTAVRWREGLVEVDLRRPTKTRALRARAAIIAVPLGVLQAPRGQAGAIEFVPDLTAKRGPLSLLAMGPVVRLVLRLRERFWAEDWFAAHTKRQDLDTLSFLHTPDRDFPVWWTAYPVQAPLLVAWCGGTHARDLASLGPETIEQRAIASLARQMRLTVRRVRSLIVRSWMHDWQEDPFARGAYSYTLVGGMDAPAALARPIRRTLFFAGEATDTEGATGTVHGAIASGRRAARQVLRT